MSSKHPSPSHSYGRGFWCFRCRFVFENRQAYDQHECDPNIATRKRARKIDPAPHHPFVPQQQTQGGGGGWSCSSSSSSVAAAAAAAAASDAAVVRNNCPPGRRRSHSISSISSRRRRNHSHKYEH
ncbi:unnamed protein product [Ectocarpus sp. 12 AP-2014]